MPHWVPSWQLAFSVAAGVGSVCLAIRFALRDRTSVRARRGAVAALIGWEAAILVALYGLWQFVGSRALIGTEDGVERGRRLWQYERDVHLPSEATVQSWFTPHPLLIKFLNLYYVVAHYNVLLIMLGWLIWRHRDRYTEARNVIVLCTFACLAVQLVPVAPPRLIGGHGIVDTALRYGQSVYGPVGQGFSDQYSAMPSVHIAWSSAVAFFAWRSSTSRWRYLGVAHALLTWAVVIITGNHYWLDGFVAIGLLFASFWTVRLLTLLWRRVTEPIPWLHGGRPAPAATAATASTSVSPALPGSAKGDDRDDRPAPVPTGAPPAGSEHHTG